MGAWKIAKNWCILKWSSESWYHLIIPPSHNKNIKPDLKKMVLVKVKNGIQLKTRKIPCLVVCVDRHICVWVEIWVKKRILKLHDTNMMGKKWKYMKKHGRYTLDIYIYCFFVYLCCKKINLLTVNLPDLMISKLCHKALVEFWVGS